MTEILRFGFLPLDKFTMTPFSALLDAIRLAADEGDQSRPIKIAWSIIGPTMDRIQSSSGVEVTPWETLGDPGRFNYLVVCGGLLSRKPTHDEMIEEYVHLAQQKGVTLIALCTGPFLLANANVLGDRHTCVSWYHLDEFAELHPEVKVDATRLFIEDRGVITCAGGPGAADLGAHLIRRHFGDALAQKALSIMVVDSVRDGSTPQPPPSMAARASNPVIRRAALLMEQSLDSPPPIKKLAERFQMSRRQLERLFRAETGNSPAAFLGSLRLERADWLIRRSELSFTRIAEVTGFSDSSHLSRTYRGQYGLTPTQARLGASDRMHGEVVTAP